MTRRVCMRVCVNVCACVKVCACKYVCNAHLCKAVCLSVIRCEGVHVCMCVCVRVYVCMHSHITQEPLPACARICEACRRQSSARLSRLDCSRPTYRSTASSRVPHANAGKYMYI
jgi:hypothetical protein